MDWGVTAVGLEFYLQSPCAFLVPGSHSALFHLNARNIFQFLRKLAQIRKLWDNSFKPKSENYGIVLSNLCSLLLLSSRHNLTGHISVVS
jgi:hypothetical protein